LQETHLDRKGAEKLNLMWRGKYNISPGEGASRGCINLFGNTWKVEDSFESEDGRLLISVISSDQLSLIIANVYAPNDHEVTYFEELLNKILEFRDKFPEHEIVIAGDFNLVLNVKVDSVNRRTPE